MHIVFRSEVMYLDTGKEILSDTRLITYNDDDNLYFKQEELNYV